MAVSILTDNTRASLEQERSRLISERDQIIQAAVTEATADLDRTLEQINHLLGNDASATPATNTETTAKVAPKQAARSTSKADPKVKKAASKVKPTEPEPKVTKPTTAAQPLSMKKSFNSMTPTQAVQQIVKEAGQPVTTDEVIQALYLSVQETDLTTARKSVGLILGRGTYQGIYEKVQENPSRYQLKA
ncbi:hypothetical protein ACQ4M3_24650 [Leptolyngbya sp. AN03gr2]|uniref:hypothetical protein n=1 Tax=unclassified Leptolyngbya TaxID=2650499 RepID=UPI003D3212C2